MDLDFKEKVAVVTFARVGKNIYLALCARDEIRLDETNQRIAQKYGGKVVAVNPEVGQAADAIQPSNGKSIYNISWAALFIFLKYLTNEFIKYNIRIKTAMGHFTMGNAS